MAVVYQSFTTLQSQDLAPTFNAIYGAVLGPAAPSLNDIQRRLEEGEVYGEDANAVARQVLRIARIMEATQNLDTLAAGSLGAVEAAEFDTFISTEMQAANLSPNRAYAGEVARSLNEMRLVLDRVRA